VRRTNLVAHWVSSSTPGVAGSGASVAGSTAQCAPATPADRHLVVRLARIDPVQAFAEEVLALAPPTGTGHDVERRTGRAGLIRSIVDGPQTFCARSTFEA